MAYLPTGPNWNVTGCTVAADGTITEDASLLNRHSLWQDIQPTINLGGFGTSARFSVKVFPLGRDRCWVGARQNNNTYMASFLLTGSGSVTSQGSQVSSASIVFNSGDGSYTCEVIYSSTFSQTGTIMGVGAMLADNAEDYDGQNGLAALRITEPQWNWGTQSVAYVTTSDRTVYLDLQTADGSQNATVSPTNTPKQIHPDYIESAGNTGSSIPDTALDLDNLTVCCIADWDGNAAAAKVLAGQWDAASQNSWLAILDTAGKFNVWLSGDGSTTHKNYIAVLPLDLNEITLCSFTWDGSSLRMYYNDVELTVANGELVQTVDSPLSGALHNSTGIIGVHDLHHGKFQEIRLYKGAAATPSQIATIAAEFSLSGLPDGGTPPVSGGDLPTTRLEMVAYLVGKGISESNIKYVNNSTGNDSNTGTLASPWLTIQKAANTLVAGQAVIIQGQGGRFFEQVTPQNSGSAGNLIWYAGDPEHPCIIDASESFSPAGGWTSEGNNMWSAPYNKTRFFSDETAYFNQTPATGLVPLSTFMAHQAIYNDQQLVRKSTANHTVEPTSMNEGEVWFKTTGSSDANFKTPTEIWVRLPGDVTPTSGNVRIASDKKYLFDWHAENNWQDGFPGPGDDGSTNANGRNYLGLANVHFKFGAAIRKRGMIALRGTGHHWEWLSISDSNAFSFTMYGENHTIKNCKMIRSGQGPARAQYFQNGAGTTLIEKVLFEDDNIHFYPPSWDAGFKISHAGDGGTTIFRDCHFYKSRAVGLWWDIFNGKNNGTGQAFLIERCIFEEQARHAIFVEHNSENVVIKNCGIFKTKANTEGNFNQTLGTGFRIAGAGLMTFENNAIVRSDGIGFYSKAGQDGRGPNNRDTINKNVFINNNLDANHDIDRCEFFGGDDIDEPGTYPWSSSEIDDNVFFNTLPSGVNYFVEANGAGGWVANDSISWFQDGTRTGGQGNTIAASAAAVVSDETDRKLFYVTVGSHTSKGPQLLVHYEDLTDTGWNIPS